MKSLKVASVLALSLLLVFSAQAQKDKSKRKSPPAQVSKEVNGTKITIDYSQPSKRGRDIFGSLEEYGKVWRTGANESTWIEISDDVEVQGKTLAAGKYGLFTIPGKDEWTIIFNKKWDGWGAYEYKEADDVLRVTAPSSNTDSVVETFTIEIEDSGDVILAWDQTKVEFSIR
ncbi:Protein of unknown function [Ekhidna lutea]|uniref:DUF2911 domain-containing protein n=1 Tax=Ekhidna lutea TaxID=447679 RepID=A0A239IRB2_EKHLU|nr:DUF2911 domain-containing protein [Ekhidna lutea]SNS95932.1 Protein of unknown function [Ekhidna lutea]